MIDPLAAAADAMQNETLSLLVARAVSQFRKRGELDEAGRQVLRNGATLLEGIISAGRLFEGDHSASSAGIGDYGHAISAVVSLNRKQPVSFAKAVSKRGEFLDAVRRIKLSLGQIVNQKHEVTDVALSQAEEFFDALSLEYERAVRESRPSPLVSELETDQEWASRELQV